MRAGTGVGDRARLGQRHALRGGAPLCVWGKLFAPNGCALGLWLSVVAARAGVQEGGAERLVAALAPHVGKR